MSRAPLGIPAPPHGAVRPGDLATMGMIARRAAIESLHDRTTLLFSGLFALVLPGLMVVLVIRPQAIHSTRHAAAAALGTLIAVYLLIAGLLPANGAISIAAGVFAGEKEKGNLAPLLATPASNRAIFGGKVLGAVLPALLYAVIAEVCYLIEIALFVGADRLRLVPVALALAMVALVPTYAVLGAAVASLISSRVRTYQSAQTLSSLVLLPIMAVLFAAAFALQHGGPWLLLSTVLVMIAVDVVLITLSAATWRREEMMARL